MAAEAWISNPRVKMLSELSAPWTGSLKQVVSQVIDTQETWAHKALELSEQTTAWTKDTPLGSILENQRAFVKQLIESSSALSLRL